MSSLPLDILASILGSLDFNTLRECSLVSRRFHLETHPLLFSHLQVNHWTWKEKCQFLLHLENSNRRKMIKKLSILLVHLPIREEHNVPTNLTEILVKSGPQIETLSIDGYYDGGGLGDPEGTPWSDLSLVFRDALSQHVMPSVQSLQLKEVGHFPLFPVLKNCPLLRNLTIGANWIFRTEYYAGGRESSGSLPEIISLPLHPFLPSDLMEAGSLSQFIKNSSP
ncbi:hypothetical protein DL96DRAFT_1825647 [Flagelloscypha sp. PMI_526]|nr:hypothetical protein DL96DRAFT_1825647 [Flagelloscypha sp. PMI_526]